MALAASTVAYLVEYWPGWVMTPFTVSGNRLSSTRLSTTWATYCRSCSVVWPASWKTVVVRMRISSSLYWASF